MAILLPLLLLHTSANASESSPESDTYTLETVEDGSLSLNCVSALLMEASTGTVLYEQNADEMLPPASVTKVMTLLLVMEAIDSGAIKLDDTVTVSANAASMGGSQVFLKEGEQMSVEDMLKCVVIASANDAAVALAEHICGNESTFVARMNERAKELGMVNTVFENTNGLDDTAVSHLTSARDIAIMSRELIKHEKILEYSSIWMDTVRNGEFGLTNTNRLVRFYKGCTGLKTGSTAKAGFCISATAEREGMSLICVIMGAESRDIRNAQATALLDWGFASYALYHADGGDTQPISVRGGQKNKVNASYPEFSCILPKSEISAVKSDISMQTELTAPIKNGDEIGRVTYSCNGKTIGEVAITVAEDVERLTFWQIFLRMLSIYTLK
ncbi:MAG: D-alanyl-D-alanine carboxypeptidase [Clostridia bacterium]|nr:D-alanyl-D-alanine carboxypeptidase [Clostridia bacterium]